MSRRLPGPLSPIGHLIWGVRILRHPYESVLDLYRRYGPVAAIGYGPLRYVYLLGRDANEAILSTQHEAFRWREAFKALIPVDGDTALVVSDGPDHARRRRLVQPAFSLRRIRAYAPIVQEEAGTLVERVLGAGEVELHSEFKRAVRRVAIRTLFGDSLGDRSEQIGGALQVAIDYANLPPFLIVNRDFPFSPYRRAMRAVRVVDEIIFGEIERRREAGTASPDLLDELIKAADEGDALTDQEVRDQVVSLIAAGYETTAALNTWMVYAVLAHPDVLERLLDELDTLEAPPSAEAVESCAYLDAVVNETLRLFGPAPISARYAPDGVQILGHQLPARSHVVYSGYVTHRQPELWDDPETFEPSRWIGRPPPDPYAFVPFGGGYRRCIGFALATLETKILVGELLRGATLELQATRVDPTGWVSMYPKGGLPVAATPRRAGRRQAHHEHPAGGR